MATREGAAAAMRALDGLHVMVGCARLLARARWFGGACRREHAPAPCSSGGGQQFNSLPPCARRRARRPHWQSAGQTQTCRPKSGTRWGRATPTTGRCALWARILHPEPNRPPMCRCKPVRRAAEPTFAKGGARAPATCSGHCRSARPWPRPQVLVSGLPSWATEEQVVALFSAHGHVCEVLPQRDPQAREGLHPGTGFDRGAARLLRPAAPSSEFPPSAPGCRGRRPCHSRLGPTPPLPAPNPQGPSSSEGSALVVMGTASEAASAAAALHEARVWPGGEGLLVRQGATRQRAIGSAYWLLGHGLHLQAVRRSDQHSPCALCHPPQLHVLRCTYPGQPARGGGRAVVQQGAAGGRQEARRQAQASVRERPAMGG